MPLYEYECPACQKVHEIMQKFSDAPMTECPECHGPVSKLISRSSFALKGTGWYTTDYKRSGKAPVSAPGATSTAASAAATSGSEPAAAAPAAPAKSTETKTS